MSIYQIILALVATIFIGSGIAKFIRHERSQTIFKLVVSTVIWGSILTFSLFPKASFSVSKAVGLGENLNTLIFIGFVVVFVILFKLLNLIERLERNLSELVRKEALSIYLKSHRDDKPKNTLAG